MKSSADGHLPRGGYGIGEADALGAAFSILPTPELHVEVPRWPLKVRRRRRPRRDLPGTMECPGAEGGSSPSSTGGTTEPVVR